MTNSNLEHDGKVYGFRRGLTGKYSAEVVRRGVGGYWDVVDYGESRKTVEEAKADALLMFLRDGGKVAQ